MLHYLLGADKIQHMDIETWIGRVIGEDSRRTAAKKIGVNDSTISRQISRTNTLSPEVVIALCREYGHPPVDGLVETGHLRTHEVEGVGVAEALAHATNEQILNEMLSRVDPQATRMFHGEDGEITPSFSGNVHQLPDRAIPQEWHELAVADSSPDHDEEDTDFD